MKTELVSIKLLKKAGYNPRTITNKEFAGLSASLEEFGFVEPIVVNKDYTIIGGHQRFSVAQKLGMKEVPVVMVDLDKTKEKKLNVILNSQKISGKFDDLLLSELLEELKFEENYEELNLSELEPLDLSGKEEDDTFSIDSYAYELRFDSMEEKTEFIEMVNKGKKEYGYTEAQVVLSALRQGNAR